MIYNLAIGGGPLGRGACSGQQCGPGNLPGCCDGGSPDSAHQFEGGRAYFRALNFSKEKQLACWDNASKVVAGDGLLLFPVHAGFLVETLSVANIHALPGFTYHLELHDVYGIVSDATPLTNPTPEVTMPAVVGSTVNFAWQSVTAANAGVLYYGSPFSTRAAVLPEVGLQPCAKHKAVVLIIDTLPTDTQPTNVGGVCVPCAVTKFGCGSNPLAGINIEVTAPVKSHGGLRTI